MKKTRPPNKKRKKTMRRRKRELPEKVNSAVADTTPELKEDKKLVCDIASKQIIADRVLIFVIFIVVYFF